MSKRKAPRFRTIKAWADIGSSGTPFLFAAGPVFDQYGPLLHIWAVNDVTANLVPVQIRIPVRPVRERSPR